MHARIYGAHVCVLGSCAILDTCLCRWCVLFSCTSRCYPDDGGEGGHTSVRGTAAQPTALPLSREALQLPPPPLPLYPCQTPNPTSGHDKDRYLRSRELRAVHRCRWRRSGPGRRGVGVTCGSEHVCTSPHDKRSVSVTQVYPTPGSRTAHWCGEA